MSTRQASCSCGQLTLVAEDEPVRVSVCHCLACKRRTGSAFGYNARFPRERVRVEGEATEWVRHNDEGEPRTYRFCPTCGSIVWYELASAPDVVAVPAGAFADLDFPAPWVSVWEERRHPWVTLPPSIER